jgi:hypothetical protein
MGPFHCVGLYRRINYVVQVTFLTAHVHFPPRANLSCPWQVIKVISYAKGFPPW